jgi:hypothetical protein
MPASPIAEQAVLEAQKALADSASAFKRSRSLRKLANLLAPSIAISPILPAACKIDAEIVGLVNVNAIMKKAIFEAFNIAADELVLQAQQAAMPHVNKVEPAKPNPNSKDKD